MHATMEQSITFSVKYPCLQPVVPSSVMVHSPFLLQGNGNVKELDLREHTSQCDGYNPLPREGLSHFLSLLFRASLV